MDVPDVHGAARNLGIEDCHQGRLSNRFDPYGWDERAAHDRNGRESPRKPVYNRLHRRSDHAKGDVHVPSVPGSVDKPWPQRHTPLVEQLGHLCLGVALALEISTQEEVLSLPSAWESKIMNGYKRKPLNPSLLGRMQDLDIVQTTHFVHELVAAERAQRAAVVRIP